MVITGFQVTYGQSSMTDTQVMEFVVKEQGKGTSQAQIVTKLMQNGVDISQIRRVRNCLLYTSDAADEAGMV